MSQTLQENSFVINSLTGFLEFHCQYCQLITSTFKEREVLKTSFGTLKFTNINWAVSICQNIRLILLQVLICSAISNMKCKMVLFFGNIVSFLFYLECFSRILHYYQFLLLVKGDGFIVTTLLGLFPNATRLDLSQHTLDKSMGW